MSRRRLPMSRRRRRRLGSHGDLRTAALREFQRSAQAAQRGECEEALDSFVHAEAIRLHAGIDDVHLAAISERAGTRLANRCICSAGPPPRRSN